MNGLKRGFTVFSFIFFLFFFTFNKDISYADSLTKSIEKEDALIIIQNYLANSPDIHNENDVVELKNLLYDIDDTLLGYHFELYNKESYLGYVIVSAQTDRSPILEASSGYFMEEKPKQDEKIYYLGAFSYVFAKNPTHLKEVFQLAKDNYINELANEISQLNQSDFLYEIEEINQMQLESLDRMKGEFELEWNQLLYPSKDFQINSSRKRLNVSRVWQRTNGVSKPTKACGPAVAVMINNYYKSRGHWVKNSQDYGGHAKYINRMIKEMKTGTFGTTAANFRDGIRRQLNVNHKTSTTPWRAWTLSGNGYFESYKTSINLDRPVALRFNNIIKGNKFAKYHFVTGIGYNGSEAIVKDPDNGKSNTQDRKFSWKTNQSKITMIITSPK